MKKIMRTLFAVVVLMGIGCFSADASEEVISGYMLRHGFTAETYKCATAVAKRAYPRITMPNGWNVTEEGMAISARDGSFKARLFIVFIKWNGEVFAAMNANTYGIHDSNPIMIGKCK